MKGGERTCNWRLGKGNSGLESGQEVSVLYPFMDNDRQATLGFDVGEQERPKAKPQTAIVQCEGYRCWASRGPDSQWRDRSGKPLKVIEVVSEF
jgi:hypothetical protein